MVYHSPELRNRRLAAHAEAVDSCFRRALSILELYPRSIRGELLAKVNDEYGRFHLAVAFVREGRFVREIKEQLGSEARSWLTGAIPANIARYSFMMVSDAERAARDALAQKQINVCYTKLQTAIEVLERLQAYDGRDRTKEIKSVTRAFKKFQYAFELYRRGVSWKEIINLTGEAIQSRIEDKTIPKTIVKYAGYPLTPASQGVRNTRCAAFRAAAQAAFDRAQAKQSVDNPDSLAKQIAVWRRELAAFHLVIDFYQKGLDQKTIKNLTKLPADDWIGNKTLPVKVTRAGLDLARRDFTLPATIDGDFSYIAGAIFATKRVFSLDKRLTFPSDSRDTLTSLQRLCENVFQTSLRDPRLENRNSTTSRLVLCVDRDALVTGILGRLGIKEHAVDPTPPCELLRSPHLRTSFIRGYFDFSQLHLDIEKNRLGIKRSYQPNILKSVAVALYLEGMYPLVREEDPGALLAISGKDELQKLFNLVPRLRPRHFRVDAGAKNNRLEEQLGSYENFCMIRNVLRVFYGAGKKLDFKDILRRSGIEVGDKEAVPRNVKNRIYAWRNGVRPGVAQRGDALENIMRELYGDSASLELATSRRPAVSDHTEVGIANLHRRSVGEKHKGAPLHR